MKNQSCDTPLLLKRKLKSILLTIICVSFLGVLMSGCGILQKKSPELTIKNGSSEEISKVIIKYISSDKNVDMGTLKPKEKSTHSIEDQTDDSIKLIYTDSLGNEHEEIIVGYVTKGMNSVETEIKKTTDGKWIVESK